MNPFLLLHLFLNLVIVIFLIIVISDSLDIDQMGFFLLLWCVCPSQCLCFMQYEVLMISLGRNIRKHMEEQRVTGRELARYIGVQENQVSRWLNDKNVPAADALYEVARYLGVTVEQLFTERTE